MRKFAVMLLVAGLVAGSVAAPAVAKRKKKKAKKPVPVEMLLWFQAPEGCTGPLLLMLAEATEGSNCGRNPFYGAGWEIGEAAGQVEPYVFSAGEGLPFTLDGTKPIIATVQVSSYVGGAAGSGVGETRLVATLSGETDGEMVEIGAADVTYLVTPAQSIYEVVVEFEPAKDFDKKVFASFDIALEQRGASVSHGHYRTVDPASKIAIPTLQ